MLKKSFGGTQSPASAWTNLLSSSLSERWMRRKTPSRHGPFALPEILTKPTPDHQQLGDSFSRIGRTRIEFPHFRGAALRRRTEYNASRLARRNNFTFRVSNVTALGVRAWGDTTLTDTEGGEERKHQLERYRLLAREITDPRAAVLLREIISELEADPLQKLAGDEREA